MTDSSHRDNAAFTHDPPQSIALVRLSALGDVCNTVPLVRAIQQAWPQARLTWIIGRVEYRLVGDLPGIEFVVFDKKHYFKSLRAVREALGGHRHDVLLQAQVSQRSTLVGALVKARRRIGFDLPRSRLGHGLVINERIDAIPFQHQSRAFLQFARHLGIPAENIDRRLPIDDEDRCFARRHQPQENHAVIISPASSHSLRNWHAAGYAEVADWIIEVAKRPVILMGGPSDFEKSLGLAIRKHMKNKPLDLIGQDTLKQALAMFERAACVITPDSGPAHFADAMGTPVVGLYAATWARRSGPLTSLNHTVDMFPEAARQFMGCEPEQLRWGKRIEKPGVMDLITPGMVIEKLQALLEAPA
ncbi:MAG TPA: glycosyltransferase family 9 protein [Wenzhouxiangella sp.]|nr:glycosyltransferase family 9 protein [Wenzhouxiangella sp.]